MWTDNGACSGSNDLGLDAVVDRRSYDVPHLFRLSVLIEGISPRSTMGLTRPAPHSFGEMVPANLALACELVVS